MNPPLQTFANHRRLPPLVFALAFVVLAAEVVVRAVALVQAPSPANAWAVIVATALLAVAYYARRNAQVVQDRLIRLEMRLRLERLLPAERHGDIARLQLPQLIALRFASDAELPALVGEAIERELAPTAIKQRVTAWQPDWHRV